MTSIKAQVEKAYKNGHLICICLHRIDWEKRVIGYVKKCDGLDSLTLEVIDEFGQKKNVKTVKLNSIKSLEVGGKYNENLEILNKNGFKKSKTRPKYIAINNRNVHKRLDGLRVLSTLCTFVFGSEYSVGIVMAVSEAEFSISSVGFDGSDNGISVFDNSSLTRIRYGSTAEDRISFLHQLLGQQKNSSPKYKKKGPDRDPARF
jgi:hypothetical protein